jgi:TonB family protein
VDEKKGEGPVQVAKAAIRAPNLGIAPTVTRPPLPGMDRAAFRRQILAGASRAGTAWNGDGNGAAGADPAVDGVLRGSTVYTLALDMPNITSYEGSWILRFTERGGSSPEDVLTAPVALRKVDPKYIASAAAEGVEGKVLLYAVIRRDGRVDEVRLVQGIDERLDASAVTTFSKWEFEPATRNGQAVDLEAVVQIPFRLKRSGGP